MEPKPASSRVAALTGYLWVVPAGLSLLFILSRGSVVPYWDQFAIGNFLSNAFERGYPLGSELFAQHNESRKLFPRLVFWLLAWPDHWDVRREMVAHWVLLVVGACLLTGLARRTLPAAPAAVVAAVGGTLLFSISQWQNLLWGIQLITSVPTVMLLVGMWVLTGRGEGLSAVRYGVRLGVAMAAAAVATYSYANGMALWVLLVPVVLLSPAPSRVWRWGGLAVLGLVGGASLVAYFATYARPGSHPPTDAALSHPLAAVQYFLAFLGNGLRVGTSTEVARVLGAGLLGLSLLATAGLYGVAILRRRMEPLRQGLPWLTLIAYAMVSAAATTAGRLPFGIQTAISERYVTFALPMAVGVLPAFYLACRWVVGGRGQVAGAVLAAGCGSLLTLHALASGFGLTESRAFALDRQQGLMAATWLDVAPNGAEAQVLLYPVPNEAREILRRLRDQGRLPFPVATSDRVSAYGPATPVGRTLGHLDSVRREGAGLTLTGWAVSPGGRRRSADAVLLAVELPEGDARLVAMTARTNLFRPDVPANAGPHHPATAGWSITVDLRYTPIPEGSRLSLWVYDQPTHTLHRLTPEAVVLPPE